MVFFVTTVAFLQTLVVLYLLPLRGNESRHYPYINALLLLSLLHLGIEVYLLGLLWGRSPLGSLMGTIPVILLMGLLSFVYRWFFFAPPPPEPTPLFNPTAPTVEPEKEPIAYGKSGLSVGQLTEGWQALETFMRAEKPYLNPDLSLDDLAGRLKLSRQRVSQILTQKAERNFYAYINEYRVADMQRLMKQKPGGRILEMAFGVGFQSKTTLNAYFRKVTGYSPTEYQQFLLDQQPEPFQI
ncbi:MAG: helix-turn-helix domain-containing protein [Rudanella sp.]|nr:helix-turn-helix domain-containing protein [Rudanella sp.]